MASREQELRHNCTTTAISDSRQSYSAIQGPSPSDMTDNFDSPWPLHRDSGNSPDRFTTEPTASYAGTHLLIDCWQAINLDDIAHIEAALREAVTVSGATLLHIHLHHFTPNGGVSGVAVLAESHISIHTWPERGYAALDVFMCGDTQPQLTVPVFKQAFCTDKVQISSHQRGCDWPPPSIPASDLPDHSMSAPDIPPAQNPERTSTR